MAHTKVLDYRGRDLVEVLAAGALGGVLAGCVMMLAWQVWYAALGQGFWLPPQLVAATYFGVTALLGDLGVVAAGLGIFLGVAALWGIGFALFVRSRTATPIALLVGLLWGAGMWLVMTYGFLPYMNDTMYPRTQLTFWPWLTVHLVYGLVLGLLPRIARALARAAAPEHAVVVSP